MISPRKKAQIKNEVKYISVKQCAKNPAHGNVRYTSNGACVACKKEAPVHPKHSEYAKISKVRNANKIKAYNKEYFARADVKAKRAKAQKNREMMKKRAVFICNEELHDLTLSEIYLVAQLRSDATNVKHHVDHIVPINGKNVCGFHAWNNLRVIPWYENLSKSNKIFEDLI